MFVPVLEFLQEYRKSVEAKQNDARQLLQCSICAENLKLYCAVHRVEKGKSVVE